MPSAPRPCARACAPSSVTRSSSSRRRAACSSGRAIEQGVAFVPGAPFYCEQPDPATLRLSFATSDVETIREGVSRLARALHAA